MQGASRAATPTHACSGNRDNKRLRLRFKLCVLAVREPSNAANAGFTRGTLAPLQLLSHDVKFLKTWMILQYTPFISATPTSDSNFSASAATEELVTLEAATSLQHRRIS